MDKYRSERRAELTKIAVQIFNMDISNFQKRKMWSVRTGLSYGKYYECLKAVNGGIRRAKKAKKTKTVTLNYFVASKRLEILEMATLPKCIF